MDGSTDYAASGFPQVTVPGPMAQHWVMIHAISRQESQFDREAVSSAGARGLMQLMGPTAKQVAGQVGLPWEPGRLVTDPSYNITLGSTYFAGLLKRYGGNHVLAVAAYNAGPGNVNKFIRANGDPRLPGVDVIDWIEAIPLTETRGYVQRVLENAVVYDLMNPGRARVAASGNRLSTYLGRTTAG
jgi:soluble lytic murein transglycosylase